ncbi:hypothetical protein [Roseiconus lacunae]|uniref:hypothetical protein n=1 Tax=Roseiconus lacunae TaxID=2605694 RepID=UPI001E347735|nr:hypothetical protein [Roseiconus lacunae]MCD0459961.1 hypothetical protein [Roseiconus lacunae]
MSYAPEYYGSSVHRGKITIDGTLVSGGASVPTIINLPDHPAGDTWQGFAETVLAYADESPINLAGASLLMQVKRRRSDRMPVLELSSDTSDITIVDATGGVFSISPQSIDLNPGDYVYDLQVTLRNGDVMTPIQGNWKITSDVSR